MEDRWGQTPGTKRAGGGIWQGENSPRNAGGCVGASGWAFGQLLSWMLPPTPASHPVDRRRRQPQGGRVLLPCQFKHSLTALLSCFPPHHHPSTNFQFLYVFCGSANEIPGGVFHLKWNRCLWAQRAWCQLATEQWTHTQPLKVSVLEASYLLTPWLFGCFTPSARKTCAFLRVFHTLFCPLKGWFAARCCLLTGKAFHSPVWMCSRKHGKQGEGMCFSCQHMSKEESTVGISKVNFRVPS